jgi:hypothetical protein
MISNTLACFRKDMMEPTVAEHCLSYPSVSRANGAETEMKRERHTRKRYVVVRYAEFSRKCMTLSPSGILQHIQHSVWSVTLSPLPIRNCTDIISSAPMTVSELQGTESSPSDRRRSGVVSTTGCIQEVPASNLSQETGYPDWGCSWLFQFL